MNNLPQITLIHLSTETDNLSKEAVKLEARVVVFLLFGSPEMWFCDTDLGQAQKLLTDSEIEKLGFLQKHQLEKIKEISIKIGSAIPTKLIVADFAILKNGEVTLVETNPGFCAAWPHSFAYLGVYGQFLRQAAGLPKLSQDKLLAIAKELSFDLWGLGIVYDFFK